MKQNSTFFDNNKLPFKFYIQIRWLTLSRIELFLLDKQAQHSVKQEKAMYDKIYLYLQAVSNLKEDFIPTLCKFYKGEDVTDEFQQKSKSINALASLVENDFNAVGMTQQ